MHLQVFDPEFLRLNEHAAHRILDLRLATHGLDAGLSNGPVARARKKLYSGTHIRVKNQP